MQDFKLVRIPHVHSDVVSQVQVGLPCSLISKVLAQLDDDITGCHLGGSDVTGKEYGPFLLARVVWQCEAVQYCVNCSSLKTQSKPPRVPSLPSATSKPFEKVDIVGPLPGPPSKNRYILVVGGYFLK